MHAAILEVGAQAARHAVHCRGWPPDISTAASIYLLAESSRVDLFLVAHRGILFDSRWVSSFVCLARFWRPALVNCHTTYHSRTRWLIFRSVLQPCLGQSGTPVVYTDPDTGIVFDTWKIPAGTVTGGMTFGVALPSDALTTDATEFIGYLVGSLPK